jgi:cytochrome d ubiquinol oxidase subunit I
VLGDESGYVASENQKMKIAAIEAEWHTEPAPAGFTIFGLPDVAARKTHAEVKVPWVLGLIATRSTDKQVLGILDLVEHARQRILSGMQAHSALQKLRANSADDEARALFEAHQADLGYGLLLLKFVKNPALATPEQVDRAAWSTVPNVPLLFWSFRLMVGLGLFFILLFAAAFYLSARHRLQRHRWFLKLACVSLPLPWIAAELGWIVAECGRQPWAVDGLLPTFLGVSAVPMSDVIMSLSGFVIFYSALAVVDAFLMTGMIRRGPAELGYWPETPASVIASPCSVGGDGTATLRPVADARARGS